MGRQLVCALAVVATFSGFLNVVATPAGATPVAAPLARAGTSPAAPTETPTTPGAFVSTAPTRLLDTRQSLGGSRPGAGGTVHLQVLGRGPVPASGVSAVVLNVTVTSPTAGGYITVYGDGGSRPTASNLNFLKGKTVPNLVVAPVGSNGKVALFNGSTGSTQLIADVAGYYLGGSPSAAGAFVSTAPTRLLDTRQSLGGSRPGAGGTVHLQVLGRGPVPASGVSAVVLNVTVTSPTAGGYITVYGDGGSRPTASNLNFLKGKTVPNLVVAPVGSNGKVALFNGSTGSTQLIADVAGYYLGGSPSAAGAFVSTAPTRLLDTRQSLGGSRPGAGGTVHLQVLGRGPVPASGVSAVVLNVTVTSPTAGGYITVYGDGGSRPTASNLNFLKGQTVPNLVVAPVGSNGKVALFNGSTGSTQLIADVAGYYRSSTAANPGAIAGTVTAASGGAKLQGVAVKVFSGSTQIGTATTVSGGTYTVTNVPAGSYVVCFDASSASGYQDQCYNGVAWGGSALPSGTTAVVVTAGATHGGVDAALAATAVPGSISGTVTAATGGAGLAGVDVKVFSGGTQVANGTTPTGGAYTVNNVPAGSYVVCFDASGVSGGYQDQCYNGVTWAGTALPSGTSAVAVTAGTNTANVNAALATAPTTGSIAGTVTAASGGAGLANVAVKVYTGTTSTGTGTTTGTGGYTVSNLPPSSSYVVCFDASGATGGPSTTGYADQCYHNVNWSGATLPNGTTAVSVTAGGTHSGIDASLVASGSGSIAGTVTAATGGAGVAGVKVLAYSVADDRLATSFGTATTSVSGAYTLTGVPASASGYDLCFDASHASGGASTTGYQDECHHNVAWDGVRNPPSGSTAVTVGSGQNVTGVNDALLSAAAISGTAKSGATGLGGVNVLVYAVASGEVATGFSSAATSSNGTYTVKGLPPDPAGYNVCFDAAHATGGSSTTGYRNQCYNGAAWNGNYPVPSTAAVVAASAGATATNVDADLTPGGAITGTVTGASGGGALKSVQAQVYDSGGNYVTGTSTDATGKYSVLGLEPAGYRVCFDASAATGGTSTTGYLDQCYSNVAWDGSSGVPPGAQPVTVTAGTATASVNAALGAGGAITGTVKSATAGLSGVAVSAFLPDGRTAATVNTNGSGSYRLVGLVPAAGPYKVCFDASAATGGTSTTGYLDQCYNDVAWDGNSYDLPAGATPVTVTAGTAATADATLTAAATIAGTVTGAGGSGGVANVTVEIFDPANGQGEAPVGQGVTAANGTYRIANLAPSSGGYLVCFAPYGATGGGSTTGYLDQCYSNVYWDPNGAYPSAATHVALTAGQARTGVDASLTRGGAITGLVTASTGGAPVAGVRVMAFDASKNDVTDATTGADGKYALTGLPTANTYVVCVDASGTGSGTGYLDQCYSGKAWDGSNEGIPSTATKVSVTAGTVTSSINAALVTAGAISGKVTAATGGGNVAGVVVEVVDSAGHQYQYAQTLSDGTYLVPDLPTANYTVCFDASNATGGDSTTGYVDQCYNGKAWDGDDSDLPSGTTPVAVTAGRTTTTINAGLVSGGKITGTVTAATGGGRLGNVDVEVFDPAGHPVSSTETVSSGSDTGNYAIDSLPAANNYVVCFDASGASGGSSTTGYLSQCYSGKAWAGSGAALPAGTTAVPVTVGGSRTGINAALGSAGAITGKVTAATGGAGLPGVTVDVIDGAGNEISVETQFGGTFTVIGLATGSYTVCFDASGVTGGSSTTGYLDQCYNGVAWDGQGEPPSGTTAVAVTAPNTHTGINAALASAGAISGRITATSGGAGLANVTVDVLAPDGNGTAATPVSTDAGGNYIVTGLAPSTTGYVVCFAADNATGGPSATGYLDECYDNVAWDGSIYDPPASGTTAISVTGANTHPGIDAALASAGAISGAVTGAGGAGVSNVEVDVLDSGGRQLGTYTSTSDDGTYTVPGLPASSTGYTVCFDASNATGGPSSTGYLDECYNNVAWGGDTSNLPSGTTPVSVTAGAAHTGINATLTSSGAISGTVTAVTGGGGLGNVQVTTFDSAGNQQSYATTADDGTYTVSGLLTAGYTVCFNGSSGTGGSSAAGYLDECYNNVSWDGQSAPPTGTSAVPVTVGATTSGINAALASAGGIAGKVSAATGGGALGSVNVSVYNSAGNQVGFGFTQDDGTYTITGLTAGTYRVCFDGSSASGGTSPGGYFDQCYNGEAWDGQSDPPAGSTPVTVAAGNVAASVNGSLASAGAISGKVTAASGGAGLSQVFVDVLDSDGNQIGSVGFTQDDGTYTVPGLPASSSGYTVCFDASDASGGSTTTGYVDQCYNGQAWGGDTSNVPTGTTAVPVTLGAAHSGVNASLVSAGGISGTVTAASDGSKLSSVTVEVFDSGGSEVGFGSSTQDDGTYTVTGLAPGTYTVCFDGSGAGSYADQCYTNVAWDGDPGDLPSGTTSVDVTAGATRTGVDAALTAAP